MTFGYEITIESLYTLHEYDAPELGKTSVAAAAHRDGLAMHVARDTRGSLGAPGEPGLFNGRCVAPHLVLPMPDSRVVGVADGRA